MDLETAIQAFGSAGHDLPREAMQWTLDHWDEVAPELLGMLERYTTGADRSDAATSAAEVLPPLRGSPAAPTGSAVRRAPHNLDQSAASQIRSPSRRLLKRH